jgi:hypothetical protein
MAGRGVRTGLHVQRNSGELRAGESLKCGVHGSSIKDDTTARVPLVVENITAEAIFDLTVC